MNTVEIALKLAIADFMAKSGAVVARSKEMGKGLSEAAQAPSKDLQQVGTVGLVMGGAVAAGFALAAHAAMNFDASMSEVQAVTGATSTEMGELRDKALQLGADTKFSAGEAASAMVELGKAGLSTADILGGAADATTALAAAGGVALPQAAEIAASAMTQFGLSAAQLPHVADLLAGAANASQASVEGLGTALGYVGPTANAAGLSIDETAVALGLLAKGGLDASKAGTGLAGILISLNPQSEKAATAMSELGLMTEQGTSAFFDAQGQLKPLEEIVGLLGDTFGGLTEQQRLAYSETIFGREALSALGIIAGTSKEQYAELSKVIGDTSAEEQARLMTDNLKGDLEELGGSFETVLIQGGSMASDGLRKVTQGLTDVVNGLGAMPAGMQAAFLGATGIVGLSSLAVGSVGKIVPEVEKLKASLEKLGPLGKGVAGHLGGLSLAAGGAGIALTGLALIYGVYAEQEAEAEQNAKDFTATLAEQTGALTENTLAKVESDLEDNNRIDNLNKANVSVQAFTDALADNSVGINQQIRDMAAMGSISQISEERRNSLIETLRAEGGAVNELIATLMEMGAIDQGLLGQIINQSDAYADNKIALQERAIQQEVATGKSRKQAEADMAAADAAKQQGEAIKKAADELRAATDPFYGAYAAQKQLTEAQAAYTTAVNDHGSVSQQAVDAYIALTDAGFDYEGRLLGLAEAQTTGAASVADLASRLEGLRAYGIDPAAAAAAIAGGKFYGLAVEAENANQKNVDIPVTTPGADDAIRKLSAIHQRMVDIYNASGTAGHGQIGGGASVHLDGTRASGGPVSPWSGYIVHDTRHPELLALNDGTSMLLTGSQGGYVTNLGAANGAQDYMALGDHRRASAVASWSDTGRRLGVDTGGTTIVVDAPMSLSFPNYMGDRGELERMVEQATVKQADTLKEAMRRSDRATQGTR